MEATLEKSALIKTNAVQGKYRPKFFDLAKYELAQVDLSSVFYSTGEAEKILLEGNYSFAYLREDKLRTVRAYSNDEVLIPFSKFLERLGIEITSTNLFKTGKYISRVFRSVKYGEFFTGLDVFVNQNYDSKIVDGLSLVSLELARILGWENAKAGMSAQFTLFYEDGLVKGNCVLSDTIDHDVVIYGDNNIKKEIKLVHGLQYVTLEPLKLSNTLRMDIQSLLNLWDLFGGEQYLEWAYNQIEQYKTDLFNDRIERWLDNFDDLDEDEFNNENWVLHRAIWHKIDYTKFPGLLRAAWSTFRKSILTYAENIKGSPVFRIPVPGGKRGYLRVDLRNHDGNGNFVPTVERETVCLDNYGNIWIHPNDIVEFLAIKGGADLDDSCAVIPIDGNRAVMFRNPNQYGEYGIHQIVYENVEVEHINYTVGNIPIREIPKKSKIVSSAEEHINPFINNIKYSAVSRVTEVTPFFDYTIANLIRTYTKVCSNQANIGIAANGDMIKSAVSITDKETFSLLNECFNWNLEKIIDATVKEGSDSTEDIKAVRDLMNFVCDEKIPMPKVIADRFPGSMKNNLLVVGNHPLDQLLEAIKYIIEESDIEILGKGRVASGKRIKGRIDYLNIPLVGIGMANLNNPMKNIADNLCMEYNKEIAIALESCKDLNPYVKEIVQREKIDNIQREFLGRLGKFTSEERTMISMSWAYEIYKSEKQVHDSILWIRDIGNLRGTASDTTNMLTDVGQAYHIKKNGRFKRYLTPSNPQRNIGQIRVWSKDNFEVDVFKSFNEIYVESGQVLIGETLFNLGDEITVEDGMYKIRFIEQAKSKKNKDINLLHSLVIALA